MADLEKEFLFSHGSRNSPVGDRRVFACENSKKQKVNDEEKQKTGQYFKNLLISLLFDWLFYSELFLIFDGGENGIDERARTLLLLLWENSKTNKKQKKECSVRVESRGGTGEGGCSRGDRRSQQRPQGAPSRPSAPRESAERCGASTSNQLLSRHWRRL